MVFDHALVAAGDEDEMLDPGLFRFLDDMLENGAVDDRQHFLRHRLGGGQETGAETGDRKDSLADAFWHENPLSEAWAAALSHWLRQRASRPRAGIDTNLAQAR